MRTAKVYKNGPDELVVASGGTLKIENGATVEGVVTAAVVDALTSTSATDALSANQGKALKTAVDAKYTAANATAAAAGLVKQSTKVAAAAGSAPTKAEFDALITALVTAGIMAAT